MAQRKDHLDAVAVLTLMAFCMVSGLQQILIKTTVAEVPPLWQATMRFAGATGLLLLWCTWRKISLFARDGTFKAGMLAGLFFAAEFLCIYLGLRDTTASRLTVFLYTSPFVVALLLPRFVASERLGTVQWLGLVIAFSAVGLAFFEGFADGVSSRQLRGDALALAAGTFWGVATIVIRSSALAHVSAEKSLFYQIAVTAAVMPLLSLQLGESWSLAYSAYAWFSILVQTAIGAFISFLTYMWLLRNYPATQVSSFTFLAPVFTLVFSVALLGEPLTVRLVLALIGVALGIRMVNWRQG
jgi:drug/metabolite transporter (DMT)-like permease